MKGSIQGGDRGGTTLAALRSTASDRPGNRPEAVGGPEKRHYPHAARLRARFEGATQRDGAFG